MNRIISAAVVLSMAGLAYADVLEIQPPADLPAGKTLNYEVVKGDCLWDLAKDFYGDPFLYPKIWKANPFIKDPHWIYPGQMLAIPEVAENKMPAVTTTAPVSAAPIEEAAPAPVAAAPAPVEAAPAPVAAPAPAPVAVKPVKAAPVVAKFPAANPHEIAEEFPPDLAGQDDTMPKRPVAPDWKPLGNIEEDDFMNATDGDVVHVKWHEDVNLVPGDLVYVVIQSGDVHAGKKKIGIYLQNVARVRITEAKHRRRSTGVIEKARDGVQPGFAVQLGAP